MSEESAKSLKSVADHYASSFEADNSSPHTTSSDAAPGQGMKSSSAINSLASSALGLGGQPSGTSFAPGTDQNDHGQADPPAHQRRLSRVHMCVNSGNFRFKSIDVGVNMSDSDFFIAMKRSYLHLRGRFRLWFSMRHFDRCEFYMVSYCRDQSECFAEMLQFEKFDMYGTVPRQLDFPTEAELNYVFNPRKMKPIPPISEAEFRLRFQKSCTECHSWHWFHRQRYRTIFSKDAIEKLPKHKMELDFYDGKREIFWGIYARGKSLIETSFKYMPLKLCLSYRDAIFLEGTCLFYSLQRSLDHLPVPLAISMGPCG